MRMPPMPAEQIEHQIRMLESMWNIKRAHHNSLAQSTEYELDLIARSWDAVSPTPNQFNAKKDAHLKSLKALREAQAATLTVEIAQLEADLNIAREALEASRKGTTSALAAPGGGLIVPGS